RLALEAAHPGPAAHPVEQEESAPADRRHGIALADLALPDEARPVLGPGSDDPLLGGGAVAVGPEEGRPVAAALAGAQVRRRLLLGLGRDGGHGRGGRASLPGTPAAAEDYDGKEADKGPHGCVVLWVGEQ